MQKIGAVATAFRGTRGFQQAVYKVLQGVRVSSSGLCRGFGSYRGCFWLRAVGGQKPGDWNTQQGAEAPGLYIKIYVNV